MNKPGFAARISAAAVFFAAAAGPGLAHRVHAGLTEITPNPRTGELEVVHRVYTHDLDVALIRTGGDDGAAVGSENWLAQYGDYAVARFVLEAEGEPVELRFVGAEIDDAFTYAYFVADEIPDARCFTVDNDLLVESFEDQVNMTNLRFQGAVRTVIQDPDARNPETACFADG